LKKLTKSAALRDKACQAQVILSAFMVIAIAGDMIIIGRVARIFEINWLTF